MAEQSHTGEPPDPHESKISPEDPRLKIARPRPRTLKRGPAVAAAIGILGVILPALLLPLRPATSSGGTQKEDSEQRAITPDKNQIPESIRNAPEGTEFLKAAAGGRATPRLGEPLPGNLG